MPAVERRVTPLAASPAKAPSLDPLADVVSFRVSSWSVAAVRA